MRTSFLIAPLLLLGMPSFAETEPADPELRAVDVLPREMLAEQPPAKGPRIPFGLTAGLSGCWHPTSERGAKGSMDLWLGIRFPRLVRSTPFVSLGTEVGFRDHPRDVPENVEYVDDVAVDSYTQLVPELRGGFVVLDPSLGPAAQIFQIYGIGGYRIANRYDRAAVRVGVGVSSSLPLSVLGAMKIPLPLPTTAEVVFDVPSRGGTEVGLRLGFVF